MYIYIYIYVYKRYGTVRPVGQEAGPDKQTRGVMWTCALPCLQHGLATGNIHKK